MSDFEKEHLEDIQSNCFWAGFLIDLPKDKAWKLADGIVEEIKFALKQANGLPDNHEKALPINSVTKRYLVEAKTERGNTLYIQAHNNIHTAKAKHDSLVEEWEGCKVQVKMIEIPNAW